jgi:hypothetical protein
MLGYYNRPILEETVLWGITDNLKLEDATQWK